MINDGINPKALCFRLEMVSNYINAFKLFLSEKIFNDLENIEGIFPSEAEVSNPAVVN